MPDQPRPRLTTLPDAVIESRELGSGPPIVLVPSLARCFRDFDVLSVALADAGFRTIGVNLRGIGASTGALTNISLHDLAGDLAGLIETLDIQPAHVLGHAFGNRVARCLAADHPTRVATVTLLGAGGLAAPEAAARAAFAKILSDDVADADRLAAVATANFAPGNDPAPWATGWWRQTGRAHVAAARATAREDWWWAGRTPMLIVQGLSDRMAPPENGRALCQALGNRAKLVELEGAAHALLPEQPARIAEAVIAFLRASVLFG